MTTSYSPRLFLLASVPCLLRRSIPPKLALSLSGRYTRPSTFCCGQKGSRIRPKPDRDDSSTSRFRKSLRHTPAPFLTVGTTVARLFPAVCLGVAALHHSTTCQFLLNGYRSRKRDIRYGICQGCPLAPLLFILALDSVYRVIQAHPEISGVRIRSGDRSDVIKVSGYAGDTAVYIPECRAVTHVVSILDEFSRISGLHTNRAKSMVIEHNPQGSKVPLGT